MAPKKPAKPSFTDTTKRAKGIKLYSAAERMKEMIREHNAEKGRLQSEIDRLRGVIASAFRALDSNERGTARMVLKAAMPSIGTKAAPPDDDEPRRA